MNILKDERLARLARTYNVAQFASFAPGAAEPRFEVLGSPLARAAEDGVDEIVADLLARVGSVNVRTFADEESKSTEFVYGLRNVHDVVSSVRRFSSEGLFTIVNETVDVGDGGVSGVSMAGVTEFAPDATPRVVEQDKNLVARLPTSLAISVLRTVYGFEPQLPMGHAERVEFSIHPLRVGHRLEHSLCWEVSSVEAVELTVKPSWPNAFSRLTGDKVYGLTIADALSLPVPRTTVVPRRIAPFSFGEVTGTAEWWTRTSPAVPQAGRFTTQRGWTDPFELLVSEDPDCEVASVLAQEGISARFSGGAASQPNANPLIEGVSGYGEAFMLGAERADIPHSVREDVRQLMSRAEMAVGSVQIEWVHDGSRAWIVQLHARSIQPVSHGVLNPGDADEWIPFDPARGIAELRVVVERAAAAGAGVEVTRLVGVTSHVGDVIRKGKVPGRLAAAVANA